MSEISAKVSVLIPSYNHAQYLFETISSVLNQTYKNFELIIFDDCSTDNTKQVVSGFKDDRIKSSFFDTNVGTVQNLNNLIGAATGDYIAILGSDDVWAPEKLELQIAYLEQNKDVAACFSWADIIDENSKPCETSDINENVFKTPNKTQGEWLKAFYLNGNCLCHSSVLIRKSVQDALGGYSIMYRQLHDYEFWIRLIMKHPIHIIEKPLVYYRRNVCAQSISAGGTKNTVRLINETKDIIYKMITNMPKNVFFDGFYDGNARNLSKHDLLAEKFKLLCDYSVLGQTNFSLAMRFLYDNNNAETVAAIEKRFGISLKDLYDKTATSGDYYYEGYPSSLFDITTEKLKRENTALSQQLDEAQKSITLLNNSIADICNSSCWKITKPLRAFGNIIKKLRSK